MYKHTNASLSQVECDYIYPREYWCVLIIHMSYTQDRRQRENCPEISLRPQSQEPMEAAEASSVGFLW